MLNTNNHLAHNIRRLMAKFGMRYDDLVECSGVAEKTLQALLRGERTPQPRTIQKLADAFGVSTDELFYETSWLETLFDEATNPCVREAIECQPDRFRGWSPADFDELHSRFGVGGELTVEGALKVAEQMNRRREAIDHARLVLETSQGELLAQIIETFYAQVAVRRDKPTHPMKESA